MAMGVTVETIRRWCKEEAYGTGQGTKPPGYWRIHISVLRKWGGIQTVEDQIRDYRTPKKPAKKEPRK